MKDFVHGYERKEEWQHMQRELTPSVKNKTTPNAKRVGAIVNMNGSNNEHKEESHNACEKENNNECEEANMIEYREDNNNKKKDENNSEREEEDNTT
jgi:hypothetical protein